MQKCVLKYSTWLLQREPHEQVWADSSWHLFTNENTHLSYVREGLWKSSSMSRWVRAYTIIRLTFKKKTFFSNLTKVQLRERAFWTMNTPFSPSNTNNVDLFVRAADTVGAFILSAFKEALVLLSSRFSLPSSSSSSLRWNLNEVVLFCVEASRDEYERDTDKTARAMHSRRRQTHT